MVLGPCKVIPQEYPHVTCRCVDVVSPGPDGPSVETLTDQLLAEFQAAMPEVVVAYRGRQRWAQTFEAVRLEATTRPARASPDVDPDAPHINRGEGVFRGVVQPEPATVRESA